ncbi:7-cyano-7-deazaguanine synthase QueC [Legionella sp. 27cVA30]|uniref:7-cyano-7-deazaguanine synthase n=1 Tax=Legionella septentrionalis TaxID=2498109 RepID=A0A433JGS2_9GAMM|nr:MULTISPECIES: 7-cyano-7-deazaguanine synthase QueC [Legionella]MCP0913837.1 7-cyano-7-deazaguanine synthase QueC [Legionella sp. 27cVA30]RUQ81024.1 7-cyano-7-deazaguanine synthase QueC [Legionella septentrionalis]
MKKAVILFSGGLDSTTVLAFAKNQNFDCYPISFNYGQKHSIELQAAKNIIRHFDIKQHKIIELSPNMFGASALTEDTITVPAYKEDRASSIPITYVPARNTIFLSIALGYAESIGAQDIFLGISHVDYSGYPDCRPEYLQAFEKLANLATKDAVEGKKITVHAPLLYLSKAETIKLGIANGVDYAFTVSCYNANPSDFSACGYCDSCTYRKKGFAEAGIADPTRYASHNKL